MLTDDIVCLSINISAPWVLFGEVPVSPKRLWNVAHKWVIFIHNDSHCSWLLFGDVLPFSQKVLGSTFFFHRLHPESFSLCKQLYVTTKLFFAGRDREKWQADNNKLSLLLFTNYLFWHTIYNQLHNAKLNKHRETAAEHKRNMLVIPRGCIWHSLAGFHHAVRKALAPTCMLKYNAFLYIPQ